MTQTQGSRWSRRAMLAGASALAVMIGTAATAPAEAQDKPFEGTQLTYWGGLIFSDAANELLADTINAWGEEQGVETEVVMINQNETVQKVSAAVASDTMPDALDLSIDLLQVLSRQGVFADVTDLYNKIGEDQGGWFEAVDNASDTTEMAGFRTGVPYGVNGNLLLRRTDLLEAAGFTEPPTTWAELVEQAEAVTQPGVYGLGLALSNVGDANVQLSILQSYGGRLADDAGETVTLDSPETREYLAWLKDAWDRGVFPPGNATWDGAGDNQAYLSGQAAFIANTGSVGIAAQSQDPELYEVSAFSPLPAGPEGSISPIGTNLRAIPESSDNKDAAKALIEYLAQPEFMQQYFAVAIYGPVLQDQADFQVFAEQPIQKGLLGLVQNGTPPAYPDTYNAAYADAYTNFIIPKMAQRVVIDGWEIDAAIEEAQQQAQAIYDKY